MPDVKLITFDLDNTLWDVETVIRQAEADMVAWIRANAEPAIEHYQMDTVIEIRATVAEALASQRVSIESLRQPTSQDNTASVVIVTHSSRASAVKAATKAISEQPFVVERPTVLPIIIP